MYAQKIQEQYFMQIKDKDTKEKITISISKAVYYNYMRPIWRDKKRRQRETQCRDKGTSRCKNDCDHCDKGIDYKPVSLEFLEEKGVKDTGLSTFSLEDENIKNELYQALHRALGTLSETDQLIAELFSDGFSQREIGVIVHLSQPGVHKRLKKIFGDLRKLLKDFE